jgi:ribosomal peptide maturation radical SAM protein 1
MIHSENYKPYPKVALISMPWAPLQEPSLGLAILKSELSKYNIQCKILHLSLLLLKYLKSRSYRAIADLWAFDDFLFTRTFEPVVTSIQLDALKDMLHREHLRVDFRERANIDPKDYIEFALKVRNEIVPKYLEDCLLEIEQTKATMIGFTCMYDQTISSLSLAQIIKSKHPETLIVFGGYAIEKPVGSQLMRCFPFIDVIAFGEGENKIRALAEASLDPSILESIPGIMYRGLDGSIKENPPELKKMNLDESPVPDFDDWFSDIENLHAKHKVSVRTNLLPVESSRGCWWGEKSHCTFCGIDDETMRYRQKSPESVKNMLIQLRAKYGDITFRFSDYILPRKYYQTLLPQLAQENNKFNLHWEMKSNVTHSDVKIMQAAGVRYIQPGIESFSSTVLKKMGKGVSGIQNILTIKLLTEHGIEPFYNVLYGFPNDQEYEYRELCNVVPMLYHLPPPQSYVPVLITRYAPLQQDPARFGLVTPLRADHRYNIIFSEEFLENTQFKLEDYCYIFEPYDVPKSLKDRYDFLVYQILHWHSLYESRFPQLSYTESSEHLSFFDSRFSDHEQRYEFPSEYVLVHRAICYEIMGREQVASRLANYLDEKTVMRCLDNLYSKRLIYQEANRFVSLALPEAWYANRKSMMPEKIIEEPIATSMS